MFLIPIIIGLSLVTGIAVLSKRTNPGFITSGPLSVPQPQPELTAMEVLQIACANGYEIPKALVVSALMEAAQKGDEQAFREIIRVFPPIAFQKQSDEPAVSEPSTPPAPSAPLIHSPLQGVNDDAWTEFIQRLRTQDPTFKDTRHVGAYHHNVQRLNELGIDPNSLTDEATQYIALETDLKNASEQSRKLINDWAGDSVQINGTPTPVTFSGLLGLIKAAGVEGAKQWLVNSESRLKYPNTTKQFLDTNGLF